METIAYKIGGTWTEVSLGALGVGVQFHVEFGTHGESKITLPLVALPPETAPAIPFEAPCIIYTGRTGTGPFSAGTILFQGRRTDNSGQASGFGASQELVIEDAWYDLRFLTLQAAWPNITAYSGTTPTYGTPFTSPDAVLFQATAAGQLLPDGTFATYAPTPVYGHIHTGQAIEEMLAYAIYFGGANLQIGQIDPACYVPFYPVRSMRIADTIKIALRVHPDCTCEIDHTTTPPTFNIRKAANLTSITLPYHGQSGNQTHLTSQVRPRPDLRPSRVAIYVKSTTQINGNDVVNIFTDIYPAVATGLRSLDASVDMCGPKLAKTTASLVTAAFDPTSLAWWVAKIPVLAPQPNGQIPASGAGALALLDATINGGISTHPHGILVTDDSGAAISLGSYGYELLAGLPCSWMTGINVIEANVVAYFSYSKVNTAGGTTSTDQITQQRHAIRVKLINTASTTIPFNQILATGETYPTGLARAIYGALSALQYNFTHTILEAPYATLIKPGKHCLNLTGGAATWTTMNAMIQSVSMDITYSPGIGPVAKTTVHCGPVAHLEAGELVQIFNLFTNRDLSKINPAERSGGLSMSGGQVTLGDDSPKENSVAATAVESVKNFTAPDATASGVTNIITQDATIGQITRQQINTSSGASITSGIVPTVYSASGAPASGTLASGAYYRIGDLYVDTTANAMYRCTTAGSNSGSAWAQISGGSSSSTVEQYNSFHAYSVGSVVFIFTATIVGGITIQPGCYICIAATPAGPSGNQIPQYPLPVTGTIYWYAIAMGISVVNVCTSSGSQQIYLNSSGVF